MSSWRVGCLVLVAVTLSGGSVAEDRTAGGRRAGMEAHVNPRTGELVPEPRAPRPPEPLPAPLPPLAEEPAPGGGTMVRLDGRFMSHLVATIDRDGRVRIEHGPRRSAPR